MRRPRCEQGFTLIELIAVIVVLGILAVIAVPKYTSLKSEAEKGTAHGVTAALRGAITILHARYLMNNSNDYNATTVVNGVETDGVTLAAGTNEITAEFPSENVYTWTYTGRVNDTPAKVAENW